LSEKELELLFEGSKNFSNELTLEQWAKMLIESILLDDNVKVELKSIF
jgi:hypothetical protein